MHSSSLQLIPADMAPPESRIRIPESRSWIPQVSFLEVREKEPCGQFGIPEGPSAVLSAVALGVFLVHCVGFE